MFFYPSWALASIVSALLLIILDKIYQRYSHKWTNEPPLLPYRIPIVGHALWYGSDGFGMFRYARDHFPGGQPFSLMLFGHRVYVFTHNKDVSVVFRKSKELPFLPLIVNYSGLGWGISPDGMRRLSTPDDENGGDSLFKNAHPFYRDALKPGPQLDTVTLKFLHYLDEALNDFDESNSPNVPKSLFDWTRTMLGLASTNAMMGPALLRDHVKSPVEFLDSALTVDNAFFLFVNRIPRFFAKKQYAARDQVLDALESYFKDDKAIKESAPMIKDREVQLEEKGISTRDIAAYTFSAYVALIANAKNITYHFLRHIFTLPNQLTLLRTEISPIFTSTNKITTLDQVNYILKSCPLLRAFYDETLRLHSSASSNRVVIDQQTHINGYTLYKGHNIILPSYIQHHSPEYFCQSPSPDDFDPSRFLKDNGGGGANKAMLRAFGGGVSLCSGRHFAGNEVLSLVSSVIWNYDITFAHGGKVNISRRQFKEE